MFFPTLLLRSSCNRKEFIDEMVFCGCFCIASLPCWAMLPAARHVPRSCRCIPAKYLPKKTFTSISQLNKQKQVRRIPYCVLGVAGAAAAYSFTCPDYQNEPSFSLHDMDIYKYNLKKRKQTNRVNEDGSDLGQPDFHDLSVSMKNLSNSDKCFSEIAHLLSDPRIGLSFALNGYEGHTKHTLKSRFTNPMELILELDDPSFGTSFFSSIEMMNATLAQTETTDWKLTYPDFYEYFLDFVEEGFIPVNTQKKCIMDSQLQKWKKELTTLKEDESTKYVVVPFLLYKHQTLLIINKENETLEFYEPNGIGMWDDEEAKNVKDIVDDVFSNYKAENVIQRHIQGRYKFLGGFGEEDGNCAYYSNLFLYLRAVEKKSKWEIGTKHFGSIPLFSNIFMERRKLLAAFLLNNHPEFQTMKGQSEWVESLKKRQAGKNNPLDVFHLNRYLDLRRYNIDVVRSVYLSFLYEHREVLDHFPGLELIELRNFMQKNDSFLRELNQESHLMMKGLDGENLSQADFNLLEEFEHLKDAKIRIFEKIDTDMSKLASNKRLYDLFNYFLFYSDIEHLRHLLNFYKLNEFEKNIVDSIMRALEEPSLKSEVDSFKQRSAPFKLVLSSLLFENNEQDHNNQQGILSFFKMDEAKSSQETLTAACNIECHYLKMYENIQKNYIPVLTRLKVLCD